MTAHSAAAFEVLVRKLETTRLLTGEERQALQQLPLSVRVVEKGQDIVSEGDRPSTSVLIVDGWACRYKMTQSGRRQILSFHIAGDIPDLQSLLLKTMDHGIVTLTESSVAFMPHEALHRLNRAFPEVAELLWRDTLVDASIYREWLLGLGQRSVAEHMGHIFCEMFLKMKAVGLATDGESCVFPITQHELADALGVSNVHTNRVLQSLRAQGLLSWDKSELVIRDWDALRTLSEFEPDYLHLADV